MAEIKLNISSQDAEIIIEILEDYLADLSMEITDTDSMEYREKLKSKRTSVQRVLKSLQEEIAKHN
jgi:predicted transcriptional regulator